MRMYLAEKSTPFIEAASSRAKSGAKIRGAVRLGECLIAFNIDKRDESHVELTRDPSLVLLPDYMGSISERGRASPASAKSPISVWADA